MIIHYRYQHCFLDSISCVQQGHRVNHTEAVIADNELDCQDVCCRVSAKDHHLLVPHRHSLDSRSGRSSSVRQARDANQGGRMTRYRQSMDSASNRPEQYHRPSRDFRQSSAQSFDSSQFRQSADFLQPFELHESTAYRQSSDSNRPTQRSLRYSQKQQAPTQDP